MVLPFNVALYSGVSVAALFAAAGAADAYAVGGNAPEFVADFAGSLNSGTEYYRSGGADTTFEGVFTHSGLVAPATMTDSDGVLKWAPHNLILQSHAFDSASWAKLNASVSANSQTDPDGGTTADRISGTGGATTQIRIHQTLTHNNLKHKYSIFVRRVDCDYFHVWASDGVGGKIVHFDILNGSTNGTSSLGGSGANFIIENQSITAAGNSYYLCKFDCTSTVDATPAFYMYISDQSTNISPIAGPYSVDLWGAHSYRSDLGGMVNNPDRGDSYVPTTTAAKFLPRRNHYLYNGSTYDNAGILIEPAAATNLQLDSDNFNTTSYSESTRLTIFTTASTTGPDGLTSGWNAVDKGTGGSGATGFSFVNTFTADTKYVCSIYLKQNGLSWAAIRTVSFTAGTGGDGYTYFDLSNGSAGTVYADHTANIENVGGGWYRCSIAFTKNGSTGTGTIFLMLANGDADLNVATDGTSSVYVYGVQVEQGSVPTSYIPTAGSTVTRAAETLTVAGSSLPANTTGMSFHVEGRASLPSDANDRIIDWTPVAGGGTSRIMMYVNTSSTTVTAWQTAATVTDTATVTGFSGSTGIRDFNLSLRSTSSAIQVASNGTAGTANTTPTALPDLSSEPLNFGQRNDTVGGQLNMNVRIARVWGTDIGEAGIEEAST